MRLKLFFLELIVSVWYLKDIMTYDSDVLFSMMITLLIYLSMKVIYYIVINKSYAWVVQTIIIGFIVLSSLYVFDPIAYFLLMNLCQLFFLKYDQLSLLSLMGLSIVFITDLDIVHFIMISGLIYYSTFVVLEVEKKLLVINERSQRIEKDRHRLSVNQLNASLYESNFEHTTRLEERNTIAQELHDELGHTLSGSTMQLEAALLVLDSDEVKAKDMFRKVIINLRDGTESIRKILKSIKPESASVNIATIKTMASKAREKSGVNVEVIYDNDLVDLTHRQWQSILMNIQEALTNMMKYSKANNCHITFSRLNKMLKVTFIDNGIGCHVVKKGMGLEGMYERTAELNGQLIVDGSKGFSIIMLYPIEKGK
jgi:signal transduction histidine kinase